MATSRTPAPIAVPEPLPAWEDGLTPADLRVDMICEFTNLRFETPAKQRQLRGPWKVTAVNAGTRGRGGSVDLVNPMGSRIRTTADMVKASALPWSEVAAADVTLGTVVRISAENLTKMRLAGKYAPTDVFVVTKVAGDVAQLARVGGDGGRFLRNVSRTLVTVVTGETITVP